MKHELGFILIIIGGCFVLAGLVLLGFKPEGTWWNLGPMAVGASLTGVGAVVAWVAHRNL